MISITIVYAILIFVVLILVHEGGHFLAAKACGVQVNEFAIGLGPLIYKKRFGETDYAIRALPLGGQCVMEGEDDGENVNPRAFNNAARWKRFIILIAGVTMNFIMGFIIFVCLLAPVKEASTPVVSELMDQFTGGDAIQPGDRIVSVDGYHIFMTSDISTALKDSKDYYFDLVIKRDGERIELDNIYIEPKPYEENGNTVYYYGFRYVVEDTTVFTVLRNAFFTSVNMVRLVFKGLSMLFSGSATLNDMAGPVGITATMSNVAKQSMSTFWYLAGMIAINLAVMNLLPIPALDGGRILFLFIEAITRRKLNPKFEGIVNGAVFVLLIGFMLVVTANDVIKLFK